MFRTLASATIVAMVFAASTFAFAQAQPMASTDSTSPPSKRSASANNVSTSTTLTPVIGWIKEVTSGGKSLSDFCDLFSRTHLPKGAPVVVVRSLNCKSRYGTLFSKDYFEVLLGSKKFIVEKGAIDLDENQIPKLDALTEEDVQPSLAPWTMLSTKMLNTAVKFAKNKVLDASKIGLTVLDSGIFGVSEFTEGTGFRATVLNSGKKAIKSLTFTVKGGRAVNDSVRVRTVSNALTKLKVMSTIEPGDTATFSKNYMWGSDIFNVYRITEIEIEFTDGTSKVISDPMSIYITDEDRGLMRIETE